MLVVDDVADGLAYAAAAVYGHPSFALEVVGITGTNGKTTTAHLVRAAIDGALGGPLCGIVGTVGHRFGDWAVDAAHTTPEADELARVLAGMRARGATHVAMEVSSIALAAGRVRAVRFRVAALTNLTQDHLDFHGSMEAYAEAKARLFTRSRPGSPSSTSTTPSARRSPQRVQGPLVRVSARARRTRADAAEIAPRSATMSAGGHRHRAADARVATSAFDRASSARTTSRTSCSRSASRTRSTSTSRRAAEGTGRRAGRAGTARALRRARGTT